MQGFENIDVQSVGQAVSLLQRLRREKKRAAVVAGGSDFLQLMKERVVAPEILVNLKTIRGFSYIREERDGFRIGALTTLTQIEEHGGVREKLLFLSTAASEAASPQIRNAGTIGGNVCQRPFCWYFRSSKFTCLRKGGEVCYAVAGDNRYHAILGGGPSYIVHPSDLAPALVALGARVKVAGPAGEKTLPLEKFFVLPQTDYKKENVLASDEIVTEFQIPRPGRGAKGFFHKVRERQAWDHAIVSVAVVMRSKAGVCEESRIVLGGVAPIPWRAAKAEAVVRGRKIDEANCLRAAEAALEDAKPLKDNVYKINLAASLIQRGLLASA